MRRAGNLVERVLDATYDEVAAHGLGALTVEAVAVRAGSSRATLYRHFPGGREELVARTIRREVERFFEAVLAAAPASEGGVVDHVSGLIGAAHDLLGQHEVLQRLLVEEAAAIVPSLATVQPMVASGLAGHLEAVLASARRRGEVDDAVDLPAAADHCSRLVLSYVGSSGRWDLDDPVVVERLVRERLFAGLLTDLA